MSNTKVSPTQNIDSELHQQAAEYTDVAKPGSKPGFR